MTKEEFFQAKEGSLFKVDSSYCYFLVGESRMATEVTLHLDLIYVLRDFRESGQLHFIKEYWKTLLASHDGRKVGTPRDELHNMMEEEILRLKEGDLLHPGGYH